MGKPRLQLGMASERFREFNSRHCASCSVACITPSRFPPGIISELPAMKCKARDVLCIVGVLCDAPNTLPMGDTYAPARATLAGEGAGELLFTRFEAPHAFFRPARVQNCVFPGILFISRTPGCAVGRRQRGRKRFQCV